MRDVLGWRRKFGVLGPSTNTVVQHATPQELNEFKQGDYYAPAKTVVQQPTAQELNQAREGDFYAPAAGE